MKEASFYETTDTGMVRCTLCPHACNLKNGQYGICNVRLASEGMLYSTTYGMLSAVHLDPVEKKPLYHFFPGRPVLSVGSAGCNLRCRFCQNDTISQAEAGDTSNLSYYPPEEIVERARRIPRNIGIAYTYNEPVVFYEYMLETARKARQAGLRNIMVTNGYISQVPLENLLPFVDAFSVDLKGFSEKFYRKLTSSSLDPVKENICLLSKAGKHFELVNLVVPGENDDPALFREMVAWIRDRCGRRTVLHLSRYFPHYRFHVSPTPIETLKLLFHIAQEYLDFVYLGNVSGLGNNTLCPGCGEILISREGYQTTIHGITQDGDCAHCCEKILKNP